MKVHITGYLSPIYLFNGKVSCGDIFVRCYSDSKLNGYWPRKRKFTEHLLPKEIVESWEPVHKELFETGSWICKTWNHDESFDIFKLSEMAAGEYIYEPNTYYSNGKLLASTYISAGEINDDRVTYRLASTEEIEAIVNPPIEKVFQRQHDLYEKIEKKIKDGFKTGLIYPHNSHDSSAYSVIQTGKYVTKDDFLNIANWCLRESKFSKEEIAQFIKDVFNND